MTPLEEAIHQTTTISPPKADWNKRYVIPPEFAKGWSKLIREPGLQRILGRVKQQKGVEIFPGVFSDDRRCIEFKEELASKLTELLPATVDRTGVAGPNGVAGNFFALRNMAGYGMNPMSTPPVSNDTIRQQLKLSSGFTSPRHKKIYLELIRLMHKKASPAKVPIRREASTGAPHYLSDIVKKKHELINALQNLDAFLSLVDASNFVELYVQFNAPIVHTIFERGQPDSVVQNNDGSFSSKDRLVNDEDAARSNFKEGKRFNADKSVVVNGATIAGHFAYRRRTVFGMSFVPNYVVASHYASFRANYLTEYEFTWKHRTPASILAKMRQYKHMSGFDVSQFDQSVPQWLIDAYVDELKNYVDPRFAQLIGLLFRAPYIMPDPYVKGADNPKTNPFYGKSPFALESFDHHLGLPSGIANNPDFGKLQMTWQYLCLIDDYYRDVIEFGLDDILRGKHPSYALLNMSDDCVILTNDDDFHNHVVDGKYKATYYAVEPESPISFLGNVPYRDANGELQLAPNIVSFFVNWWVPEVGINHKTRRDFWSIGDRERRKHYSRAPSYSAAFILYEDLFHKHFGVYPTSISASYYERQKAFSYMSYEDALVMQKPEVLLYMIDESQVSPSVLNYVQTSISAEDSWRYTSKTFKEA